MSSERESKEWEGGRERERDRERKSRRQREEDWRPENPFTQHVNVLPIEHDTSILQ